MRLLENGYIEFNGEQYAPDSYTDMQYGECLSCGWSDVDNAFWIEHTFQEHECLTKKGTPRRRPSEGFMRAATALELYHSLNKKGA